MRTFYIGDKKEWKEVKDLYIGKEGSYIPTKLKVVGYQGKWVEVWNKEPDTPKEAYLHIPSLRGANPWETLHLKGFNLLALYLPGDRSGSFYTLSGTRGDFFGNYDNFYSSKDYMAVINKSRVVTKIDNYYIYNTVWHAKELFGSPLAQITFKIYMDSFSGSQEIFYSSFTRDTTGYDGSFVRIIAHSTGSIQFIRGLNNGKTSVNISLSGLKLDDWNSIFVYSYNVHKDIVIGLNGNTYRYHTSDDFITTDSSTPTYLFGRSNTGQKGMIKDVMFKSSPPGVPYKYTSVDTKTGEISKTDATSYTMSTSELQTVAKEIENILTFKNLKTNETIDCTANVLKNTMLDYYFNVPNLEYGNYEYYIKKDTIHTNSRFISITPLNVNTSGIVIDFTDATLKEVNASFMAGHKQWGGANGGITYQNISYSDKAKYLSITACGDNYTGKVYGVNKWGKPSGFNARIGGCIVSRDYFGPGSFRITCTVAKLLGVATAFWTFHYEEGYEGTPLWDSINAEGLHDQGNSIDGYYKVRNHEIDIELPSALKTDCDQEEVSLSNGRFNTWQGELRNWSVENNDVPVCDPMHSETNDPAYWSEYEDSFVHHGIDVGDGKLHEFRFDWHTDTADPRVEFYIDGTHIVTNRRNIPDIPQRLWLGMWFPSASVKWAGKEANWDTQTMQIHKIEIIPYKNEPMRLLTDTYKYDVYRDIVTNEVENVN